MAKIKPDLLYTSKSSFFEGEKNQLECQTSGNMFKKMRKHTHTKQGMKAGLDRGLN